MIVKDWQGYPLMSYIFNNSPGHLIKIVLWNQREQEAVVRAGTAAGAPYTAWLTPWTFSVGQGRNAHCQQIFSSPDRRPPSRARGPARCGARRYDPRTATTCTIQMNDYR